MFWGKGMRLIGALFLCAAAYAQVPHEPASG
jgi:hypothetical protein